jgi:signal transduction histidine kinase
MKTRDTRYGTELLNVPAICKDQTRISVEFSVTLVRGPAGEVLGVAAIMRDVTQAWNQQKELRQRLADLEARVAATA